MSSKAQSPLSGESLQKINSPPPKPPRRRHSDQSSKISGTYAASRKREKHFNGTLPSCTKANIGNDVSGCESLPANWVPACCENQEKEGSALLQQSRIHSSPKIAHYFCKPPLIEDDSLSNKTLSDSLQNLKESASVAFVSSVSTFHSSIDRDFSSLCNTANHSVDVAATAAHNTNDLQNNKFPFLSSGNSKPMTGKEMSVLLRRHHSDPLLTRLSRSFQAAANANLHHGLQSSFNLGSRDSKASLVSKDCCFASEEVKVLKQTNDKLWKHLCCLQTKLDGCNSSAKIDTSTSSFADFMLDVYKSQKEKDIAFENRLKVALEQRDAAVRELEQVLKSITRCCESDDFGEAGSNDQELRQIFCEIETMQNPVDLLQQQRILLALLWHSKETKLHRLSHELKLALQEKKHALDKAEKLEEELMKWKSSRCLLHSDARQWEAGLLDALCQVITQRDSALSKLQCVQEQMKSFQIHHSSCQLQKSVSGDLHNSDYESLPKFDTAAASPVETSLAESHDELTKETRNINHIHTSSDEVKFLKCQISYLTKQLDYEIKRRQAAEENCQKLDRLVLLLRKNINGLNVGIPV